MKSDAFPLKYGMKTYTLKKRIFAAATFKGLWVASFQKK